MSERRLEWSQEQGRGFFPVKDFPYNENYFDKYTGYAKTKRGRQITAARVDMVRRHYAGPVVDVGIGCGQFVEAHRNAEGYDVNPAGVLWLKKRGAWCNIYNGHIIHALTFWDSLEHIENIEDVVSRARQLVFVSLPIFRDLEHVLGSKHYRQDEHYWYFTHSGFIKWFEKQGFNMLEFNNMEQDYGREDITSYVFRRRDAGRGQAQT